MLWARYGQTLENIYRLKFFKRLESKADSRSQHLFKIKYSHKRRLILLIYMNVNSVKPWCSWTAELNLVFAKTKNNKNNKLPPTQTHQGLHQPLYSSTALRYVISGYFTSYFVACLLLWCLLSDAVSACCTVGSSGWKCQLGSMLTIKLTLTFDFENLKTATE